MASWICGSVSLDAPPAIASFSAEASTSISNSTPPRLRFRPMSVPMAMLMLFFITSGESFGAVVRGIAGKADRQLAGEQIAFARQQHVRRVDADLHVHGVRRVGGGGQAGLQA